MRCLLTKILNNFTQAWKLNKDHYYLSLIHISEPTRQEAKQAADKLLNLGIKKVIITLGEKGLFYSDGKEEIYLKAYAVKAIDTTGAGDAFNGGLAFNLSKEKPIKECLELANKVAGISTTKLGAGDSMPFIKDIK